MDISCSGRKDLLQQEGKYPVNELNVLQYKEVFKYSLRTLLIQYCHFWTGSRFRQDSKKKKQVVFSSDGIETTCSKGDDDDDVEDEDKVMQRAYQNKTQRSTFTLNTKKNDTVDVPPAVNSCSRASSRMPTPPR